MPTDLVFVDVEKVLELMVRKLGSSHPLARRVPEKIMRWRGRKVVSQCWTGNGFVLELGAVVGRKM